MARSRVSARSRSVKSSRLWANSETDFLREHYAAKGARYCSIAIGRSVRAVTSKAASLGIQRPAAVWTSEKDNVLLRLYQAEGARAVGEIVGLSEEQVRGRAKYLGIKVDRVGMNNRIARSALGNPGPRKWTSEMLAVLRENYATKGSLGVGEILGIKPRMAQSKARELGIRYTGPKYWKRTWTEENIATLLAYYPSRGSRFVARLLGVKSSKIYQTAKRLGIRRIFKPKLRHSKYGSPEHLEKLRLNLERCRDPAYRRKMRELALARWRDPTYRESMLSVFNTPERIRKLKVSMIKAHRRRRGEKWSNDLRELESVLTTKLEEVMTSATLVVGEMSKEQLESHLDNVRSSTDAKWLMNQLKRHLATSVQQVVIVAAIIRQLEELGHQVEIKIAALPYLRKIAYGNMLPELYVALEGDHFLLAKASSLPTPDQERVARNEPVKVMTADGDHRMVPPLSMTREEIFQVFDGGRIRDETEQVGWIRSRVEKEARRQTVGAEVTVTVDKKRGGIIVAGKFLSLSELLHYVGDLSARK